MIFTSFSQSLFPKALAVGLLMVASAASAPALAGENCQCRAAGTYYDTGAVVCMGSGSNRQLARCEMSLNNTSWKMLGEACPFAALEPALEADQLNMSLRQDRAIIR